MEGIKICSWKGTKKSLVKFLLMYKLYMMVWHLILDGPEHPLYNMRMDYWTPLYYITAWGSYPLSTIFQLFWVLISRKLELSGTTSSMTLGTCQNLYQSLWQEPNHIVWCSCYQFFQECSIFINDKSIKFLVYKFRGIQNWTIWEKHTHTHIQCIWHDQHIDAAVRKHGWSLENICWA